jgi:phage terminase large subunit GpA-like protein
MNARVPNLPNVDHAAANAALGAMFGRVWVKLAPPPPLDIGEWAETYRELSSEESAITGRYSLDVTPALRGILSAASDRKVRKIVTQKSAQVGYTAGVVCNVLAYHTHYRPSPQIAMFPREKSATDFDAEKFTPMVRATKALSARIQLKSRAQGNSTTRKRYPGGFIKFVASNSPSDVKSTSARVGIIEEPDDTSKDVRGQGNSITLLGERLKSYAPGELLLIGGTPTAKGASQIEKEMRTTDQRYFMVTCHDCGEEHTPSWAHVTIPEVDDQAEREIYGKYRWESAYYSCPHCGSIWTDDDRIAAIKAAAARPDKGWVPTAKSSTPGFYLNELLSTFDGSRVPILAEKYLVAKYEMDRGEPEKMVAFRNSTEGLPWEYKGELPEEDELRERAEDYAEWSCPAGGLLAVMSVDVQHDRLAVTVWVIGRGEEMWLAYWGEHHGQTIVPHQGAWVDLEQLMTKHVRHATGAKMPIAAVGIDCSDGQTSDATYAFVRKHDRGMARPVLALKGASDAVGKVEIWTTPKAVDPNKRATKATRAGVKVNIVGSAKAKDLILGWAQEGGRVRLSGIGPGRMHWYKGVRDDFFEQLLGEMKIPSRYNPRVREWTERTDRRNEALDCTVYALYLSRHLRLHLKKPHEWAVIENRLRQLPILLEDDDGVFVAPGADGDHPSQALPVAQADQAPDAADASGPAPTPAPAPEPVPALAPAPAQQFARPVKPKPAPAPSGGIASAEWSGRL